MAKEQKVVEETPEEIATKKRDEELTNIVENYNSSKRSSALIDMHKTKKMVIINLDYLQYISYITSIISFNLHVISI